MASAHFMVDGYGNIYAPLLPLLIPRLDLSLAAAGTLTMLLPAGGLRAQVGFGHLADRWRPRVLVMVGPVVAVRVLSLVGLAHSTACWRRSSSWAVSAARRFIRRRRRSPIDSAATIAGWRCRSTSPAGRWASPSVRCSSRPSRNASGSSGRRYWLFPGWWSSRCSCAGCRRSASITPARSGFASLRPMRSHSALLYAIVVLRTLTSLSSRRSCQ